jgi:hypothetical protein
MKTVTSNKSIILLSSFIFLNSCNGQMKSLEECRLSYKNARTKMNDYYKNSKISSLQESLNNVENSIKCPETRYESINLKISVLLLMKKYDDGYKFVDSLGEDDFNASYKKKLIFNEFRAFDYESKSDTANRNRLFSVIVDDIQKYIQNENMTKDTLNDEAYILLFSFKKRLIGLEKVNMEIDSLKVRYPLKKDYFDDLKNAIRESPITNSVSAMQN